MGEIDRKTERKYLMKSRTNIDGKVDTVELMLNKMRFTFDRQTGSLVRLANPNSVIMIEAGRDQAGLIDLACPVKQCMALRLASRFSNQAVFKNDSNGITISWNKLGTNRSIALKGNVIATVRLQAAPDDKSIIMSCHINNQTEEHIRQALFPDFMGLIPFGGDVNTRFCSAGEADFFPFLLECSAADDSEFYGYEARASKIWKVCEHWFVPFPWFDFGNHATGFSFFHKKKWTQRLPNQIRMHRSPTDGKARLSYIHNVDILPRTQWESGEFWLTPHDHGWAEGIEPFRKWMKKNVTRKFSYPTHVREGLGLRTTFHMRGRTPNTPEDVVFSYNAIVKVAEECKEHGITEISPWFWCEYFQLPVQVLSLLGTEREFAVAVKACRKMGVNITPFYSVRWLESPSAERYGTKKLKEGGWTYHLDTIPMMNPKYSSKLGGTEDPESNQNYQDDVFDSFRKYFAMGIPSINWDCFVNNSEKEPNLYTLTSRLRKLAKQYDPESVFCGEILNFETDISYLDYTWSWVTYGDPKPGISGAEVRPPLISLVTPYMRLNANINASPLKVKKCFMHNLYMNIMPGKPGDVNGSAMIADYPELSQALKQCARLRKQFLGYFTDGKLIGDCILSEKCPEALCSAYILDDRLLIIALNLNNAKALRLKGDLGFWLKSESGQFEVKVYDAKGKHKNRHVCGKNLREQTGKLQAAEFSFYEISPFVEK